MVDEKLKRIVSKFVLFIWLLAVLFLVSGYNATLSSLLTIEQFQFSSKGGIVGFHGESFMRGVTINNLHFEGLKNRPFYSYEGYAHALSKDGVADAIVDELPYIKMFLSKYPGDYDLVSVQPITSGFGFIFQKGSSLAHDMSREIAKIRLDETLANLENRWFENRLSIPSRNSTRENAMKLDKFGGVFIANVVALGLAFIVAAVCYLLARPVIQDIMTPVFERISNTMTMITTSAVRLLVKWSNWFSGWVSYLWKRARDRVGC